MMEAPSAAWPPAYWAIMLAMWWIMMIAMMVPSAAPTILLYARVHRHGQSSGAIAGAVAPTGAFAAGYLFTWFGFALAAAALHWAFERAGLISPMMMGSQNRWFSAALLFSAGLYQFSPLKEACLSHCRSPAEFISRHWSAQPFGALTMGVRHGAYCVGCCWMLMALLFVGGVMNLVWIAALAVLVLVEKLLPLGRWAGRVSGAILLVWGAATMMV